MNTVSAEKQEALLQANLADKAKVTALIELERV